MNNQHKPNTYPSQTPARRPYSAGQGVEAPKQPNQQSAPQRQYQGRKPIPQISEQSSQPQAPQLDNQQRIEPQEIPQNYIPNQMPHISGKNKKGIIGAVIAGIALIAAGAIYFTSQDKSPLVSGLNLNTETTMASKSSPNSFGKSFDGKPVPIKWPSDITPSKMEIHLDPVTGSPNLILIGEKDNLGTVIRSHNQSGDLTGFWVITPDEPALSTQNSGGIQVKEPSLGKNLLDDSVDTSNAGSNLEGSTLTKEQLISNDVHTILQGKVSGKSAEELATSNADALKPVAEKYAMTATQVVQVYIGELAKLNN